MKRFRNIQFKLLAVLAFLAISITSCVDAPEPSISVDKTTLTTEAYGDNFLYKITSNAEWTLKSDSDWCVPSQTEGLGTETINIKVGVNSSTSSREATLTLTCGGNSTTIKVLQGAQSTVLQASPESTTVSANDQTLNVVVVSNDSWTTESSHSWATITKGVETGSNNGVVSIAVDENTTGSERTATLTAYVTRDNEQSLVSTTTITQNAKSAPTVDLSQSSVKFSSAAGSLLVPFVSNTTDITLISDFSWCVPTLDGDNVKISVSANTTSTSSRVAIVTVSALVDGKATSTQILVTQEGSPSSELYIITTNHNIAQAGGNSTLQYSNTNGSDVTIKSLTSWILVSTSGNTFSVFENLSTDSRVGTIEIASENSTGKSLYYVTVTQAGTGTPSAFASPSSVSLAPESGLGTVNVFVDSSVVTWEKAASSSSWLTINSIKDGEVSYSYTQSTSDAIREATISVIYKVGSTPYSITVPVVQNGLGAPTLSTLEQIFVQCDETSRTVDLWMLDGDTDNVTYQVFTESYGSGVSNDSSSSDSEWIRQAYVKDHQLIVDFYTNLNDSERYGTITIIATRGDSQTITKIEVVQGGHLSAGISAGSQEIFHDYQAAEGCEFAYTSLNNSSVTVVSTPDWISNTAIKYTNDGFTYDISMYTGGITGTFREGYIVLRADNGSSNTILYSILVRQYAPEDAEADYDSSVYVEYGENEYSFILDLQNSATIKNVSSNVDWLAIGEYSNTATGTVYIPYTVLQFTGATGTSREAKVTITVENANANTSTYTITVTQGEPVEADADVPGTVYVPYGVTGSTGNAVKSSHNFSIELTAGSSIYDVKVIDPTVSNWLGVTSFTNPSTSSASAKAFVYFNTTTNLGDEGERTGILAVTVQSANANKEVYYVDIVQGTPEDPIISITSAETYPYSEADYTVDFNVPSTVTAVYAQLVDSSNEWVTGIVEDADLLGNGCLSFSLTLNDTGLPRTAVVMLTAEGDSYRDAVTYFTITQEELGAVSTSYPSTMYVPNTGTQVTEDGDTSIDFVTVDLSSYLYNNGKITGVEVSQGNGTEEWLYVGESNTDYTFTYKVDLFAGPEESRTGTITLTLKNDNAQVEKHVITVIQGAVVDAAADVPASYTFGYEGVSNKDLTKDINLKNGSSIASIKVVNLDGVTDNNWLSVSDDNKLTVTAHDGLNGSRSGKLLVTISNDSYNDEFYYIDIYQGVPDEPTIEVPEYTLAYDYSQHSNETIAINAEGAVTVSTDEDWIEKAAINSDGKLQFDIILYDESTEDFREGTITLVSSNDNYRDAIAYVSIRQYAQGEADIEGLSEISVSSQEASYNTWINLLNNSTIKYVRSTADWLSYTEPDKTSTGTFKFDFAVEAYDGTAGDNRQAVIYIGAQNTNDEIAIYTLTVTQGAPSSDLAEVSGSVNVPTTGTNSVDSDAAEYSFNTTLASGAKITKIEVLDANEIDWITLGDADAAADAIPTATELADGYDQAGIDVLSYYVAAYDGSKGDSREGIIAMTVQGPDGNVVIYNIIVTQGAAVEQILTVGTEATFDFDVVSGIINYNVSGDDATGITVTANKVSSSIDWLKDVGIDKANKNVTFTLTKNDTGVSRSTMIEVHATGSYFREATAYVKVTQTAEGAAMMDEIATQYVGYTASEYTIDINLKNGATIKSVTSNNADMLTKVTETTEDSGEQIFKYAVTAFTDPTNAGSRTGTMSITVANDNAETATYSLTVVQGAPAEAGASVPASVTVPYIKVDDEGQEVVGSYRFLVTVNEGSKIAGLSIVPTNCSWLTADVSEITLKNDSQNTYLVPFKVSSTDGNAYETDSASIMVLVTSDNANSEAYYVEVIRGTPTDPVINIEQSFTYDYNATDDNDYPAHIIKYTAYDATTVTATVEEGWLSVDDDTAGQISVSLDENTTGAPRSATMTVTATGDSYRSAITYVTITQNELGAASVNAYSTIYAPYSGTTNSLGLSDYVLYDLSNYLENGALITDVTYNTGSDSTDWLSAALYSPDGGSSGSKTPRDGFAYKVAAYDGAENTSRTGTITLTLENSNDEKEYFTFTVIQGASTVIPDEVSASTVESMSIPYAAGSYTVPVVPTEGLIEEVAVVSTEANWLEIKAANDKKSATVTTTESYTESTPRSAIVSVKVVNGDASATYLVTVYQGVSEDASITVPSEVLAYDYSYSSYQSFAIDYTGTTPTIEVSYLGDETNEKDWVNNPKISTDETKVEYGIAKYTGTSNLGYRQALMTLTNENNGRKAVAYVTIRQYSEGEAGIESVSSIFVGSDGVDTDEYFVTVNLLNGAVVEYLYSSASWINIADDYIGQTSGFRLKYGVDANTSTSSRQGEIYIKAANNEGEICQYTITVTQQGADPIEDATISTVPDVELLYGATAEGTTNDVIVSVGDGVTNVNASHTADWIHLTSSTKAATDTDYDYTPSSNKATVAFTVDKNSTGATRTEYITLTASGTEVNTTVTYLKVSQNAEGDATLSYDTILYVPYTGVGLDDEGNLTVVGNFVTLNLASYLENDAVVTAVSEDQGSGDGTWLNASLNGRTSAKVIYYGVAAYDGAAGTSRTGYIVATVSNETSSKTYRIQVIQGASTVIPDEVSASTVESMNIPYSAGSYTVPVVPTDDATTITDAAVVSEEADWLSIEYTTTAATVTTTEDYASTTSRSAVVSVTVTNGDATATYLVTVNQGVAAEAVADVAEFLYIEAAGVANIYGGSFALDGSIPILPVYAKSGSTISSILAISGNEGNWFKYKELSGTDELYYYYADAYEAAAGNTRTCTLSVSIKSADGTLSAYYMTVIQTAGESIEDATINVVPALDYSYGATTADDANAVNKTSVSVGTGVEKVTAYNESDWITLVEEATSKSKSETVEYSVANNAATIQFTLDENTTGESREAYIRLTASGSSVGSAVTYLKVTQSGTGDVPEVNFKEEIYLSSDAVTNKSLNLEGYITNGGVITKAACAQGLESDEWLTISTAKGTETTDGTTTTYAGFNDYKVWYNVAENTNSASRTGKLNITVTNDAGSIIYALDVIQLGTGIDVPTWENLPTHLYLTAYKEDSSNTSTFNFSMQGCSEIRFITDDVVDNYSSTYERISSMDYDFNTNLMTVVVKGGEGKGIVEAIVVGTNGTEYRVDIYVEIDNNHTNTATWGNNPVLDDSDASTISLQNITNGGKAF